jgi:hypothetical protein
MERDGLISPQTLPAGRAAHRGARHARGLALVGTLSQTIESHYQWMESQLGKERLAQLYALLDHVIALEAPDGVSADGTEE